jgi:lipoate-protein ligase A
MVARPALVSVRVGSVAAVVLGRAQRELPTDAVLPVRLRASGGGAVLTGPWLMRAAVLLPATHPLASRGPAAAAHWFGEVHRRWLQAQGLGSAVLHAGATAEHWACFAGRGPGEVLIAGRKIVGIAQAWRRRAILLSSGTLLSPPPWPLLCAALRRPRADAGMLAALTVSATDCLGREIDAAAWADALRDEIERALEQAEAGAQCPGPMDGAASPGRATLTAMVGDLRAGDGKCWLDPLQRLGRRAA